MRYLFQSDTIRLVQNGCSFHGLRSEDLNQHLKDFLKLMDSLDLDGSITTWEDLTTHFIAQFFPSGRTAKLHNFILMFQQHHEESISKAWTRFKDLLQKELRKKGIKIPSKLLKYLSPASIKELNKNLSAPKHVHFVNSIVILSKDSDTKDEDISSNNTHEHGLSSMMRNKEEVKEQGKEENEMEIDEEVEEVFKDEESKIKTKEEVEEVFDDETKKKDDDDTKYYNSPPAIKELVYHDGC
uniref:Retrotransposon gag domain-containing protein n=1 Tax=Tanacetum cinerariifolium TaxID=118510 RepID=A0A699HM31_TANCI|nr:hypothetical protein [Tanacetum cinerariifolium]